MIFFKLLKTFVVSKKLTLYWFTATPCSVTYKTGDGQKFTTANRDSTSLNASNTLSAVLFRLRFLLLLHRHLNILFNVIVIKLCIEQLAKSSCAVLFKLVE